MPWCVLPKPQTRENFQTPLPLPAASLRARPDPLPVSSTPLTFTSRNPARLPFSLSHLSHPPSPSKPPSRGPQAASRTFGRAIGLCSPAEAPPQGSSAERETAQPGRTLWGDESKCLVFSLAKPARPGCADTRTHPPSDTAPQLYNAKINRQTPHDSLGASISRKPMD